MFLLQVHSSSKNHTVTHTHAHEDMQHLSSQVLFVSSLQYFSVPPDMQQFLLDDLCQINLAAYINIDLIRERQRNSTKILTDISPTLITSTQTSHCTSADICHQCFKIILSLVAFLIFSSMKFEYYKHNMIQGTSLLALG